MAQGNPVVRWGLLVAVSLGAALLLAPTPAAAQIDDCRHQCFEAFSACLGSACEEVRGCADGSACVAGRCENNEPCGAFPAGCDAPCMDEVSRCHAGCLVFLGPTIGPITDLLGEEAARPLLESIAAADATLDDAIGHAAPIAGKHLTAFRQQVRELAAKQQLSHDDAAALEKLVLGAEIALLEGDLDACVSGLIDTAAVGGCCQCRGSCLDVVRPADCRGIGGPGGCTYQAGKKCKQNRCR